MIPFSIQVVCYRLFMCVLKWVTPLLRFRQPELHSGPGSSLELCDAIAQAGVTRLLVVTDGMLIKLGLLDAMRERLQQRQVTVVIYDGVMPDPTIEQIEQGLALLRSERCTAILAVGGGSSIDAAKVIAARATNPHPIAWMGGLLRILFKPMALYVVPTTAGTGSEVTIAAVVSDPARARKFAIMDPKLVPVAAALDAALMTGLPPAITAATGMDALTHAVEAYISRNATPATDAAALAATRAILRYLPKVMVDGQDLQARHEMAVASYQAGVAFTTAGVGYVHAISHNLGARYHVPHGLANAIVLPYVLDYSEPACTQRLADLAVAGGLQQGEQETAAELARRFIDHVRELNRQFGIPDHVEKLQRADIPAIADAALREAHWTYAVPRYMDKATCEAVVGLLLKAA